MTSSSPRKRVAVLISGRGSNMTALIDAAKNPDYPAEIVAVIANKADAGGLDVAKANGIATHAFPNKSFASRDLQEAAIHAALLDINPDIVCLAGYMRLMSEHFVQQWEGRMINIHPALLPSFKGLHTHERALDAGVRVHGCTVHFVTAGMDEGPIIVQVAVPVLTGDDPDTLSARVLKAEHQAYPEALRMVAEGTARMIGGRTVFSH